MQPQLRLQGFARASAIETAFGKIDCRFAWLPRRKLRLGLSVGAAGRFDLLDQSRDVIRQLCQLEVVFLREFVTIGWVQLKRDLLFIKT